MEYKHHLPCQEGTAAHSLPAMDEESKPPPPVLTAFYRGTIDSIVTSSLLVCYGSSTASDKSLQRVVLMAEKIIRTFLPSIQDATRSHGLSRATKIVRDPTHHGLFNLLPTGKHYHSLWCKTQQSRLSSSHQTTQLPLTHNMLAYRDR